MKKNVFLFFILIIFISCKQKEDAFKGVWMAYKVDNMQLSNLTGNIGGRNIADLSVDGRQLDSFVLSEQCRVLAFENDHALLDDGEAFGQNVGNWKISDDYKQLIIRSVRGNEKFDIVKVKDKVIILRKQYKDTKDSLLYTLYPFEGKNTAQMKESLRYLMTKPTQSESDEQLKMRLKHALLYYSSYFYIINEDANINSFRPMHIYIPIQFFSGGIGIKTFVPNAEWVYLFYNEQDALKALQLLTNALRKVGVYPSKNNRFALEYAEVLKEMASNL